MTESAQHSAFSIQHLAAVRHAVYREIISDLPIASYDQARQFAANLSLCRSHDPAARERQLNAVMTRFMLLNVTPDIGETANRGLKLKEIEYQLNRKYGDLLQHVPGMYRREAGAPFRLNLPFNCAMYGYGSNYGPSRIMPKFYSGILCQPLDRNDFYFLLSSSKFGGPKAIRLEPRDQQYFTQFEEVRI